MKKVCLSVLAGLVFLFASCKMEVGMGAAVDLEAPQVTIESPQNFSKVHLSFELSGTCYDNSKVTEIVITNQNTGKVLGKATIIDGKRWTFPIVLDKSDEGELTLLVSASDKAGNESTKSKQVISYLVDDTDPESQEWYIEKSAGITINLRDKEILENIDISNSVNKDIAQNQSFVLHGKVSDAMSINYVEAILKDESGAEIISKKVEGSYNPEFTFTHDELVQKKSELASGRHYLQVSYICEDDHGNKTSGDEKWILWYPESDFPGISQKSTDTETNTLSINITNPIPVDIFDDDQIQEIYISLKNETSPQLENVTVEKLKTDENIRNQVFDEANLVTTTTDDGAKEYLYIEKDVQGGKRDESHSIDGTATENAAQMKLVICIKDIYGLWNAKIISVLITDGETPIIQIEKPKSNSVPDIIEDTKFEISGYTLDKRKNAGIVKVVYIPKDVTDKQNKAKEIFADKTINWKKDDGTGSKDFEDGIKLVWKKSILDDTYVDTTNKNWKKRNFSFKYDLLADFGANAKNEKYFGIMYTDSNGNEQFTEINVDGDNIVPNVEVISPKEDMKVINPETESIELSFKGSKDTGLGMDENAYKIVLVGTSNEYSIDNGKLKKNGDVYSITLSSADLKTVRNTTSQPTFEFHVTDKLGNTATDRRTVVLSILPKVESITTDKSSGTYKTNDVLSFQVNFDGEVKVTGTPKLKIYYTENPTEEPKEAVYVSGNNTKTLNFNFTVPENASSERINCRTSDYLLLDENCKIETANIGSGDAHIDVVLDEGKILNGKTLKIDSVAPLFTTVKWTNSDGVEYGGKKYLKAGCQISAVLTATENLLVSGSPKLVLLAGIGSSAKEITFNFQSVNEDTVTFVSTIPNDLYNCEADLSLNGTVYISSTDASFIKDSIGNSVKITEISKSAQSDSIFIDTKKPFAPTMKLNGDTVHPGDVNTEQILTIDESSIEQNANVYYTIDGSTWKKYENIGISLNAGKNTIGAKQYDIAGNESVEGNKYIINVDTTFPNISSLSIDKTNGYYKSGDKITFTVSFDDAILLPKSKTGPQLKFTDYNGNNERTINFNSISSISQSIITATYTVQDTDDIQGIKISKFIPNELEDIYGNKPSSSSDMISSYKKEGQGWRENIILDSVAPKIASTNGYTPIKDGVLNNSYVEDDDGNVSDRVKIVLKFTEPVYVESGYITLQRIGADNSTNADNWAIPALLSNEDFMNIYNQLGIDDREILMNTIGKQGEGAEELQADTARPVGPYMKYTHGIKDDGSPDTTTKFVLAPEYDLFGTTDTVKNIRTALKKTGYHQHRVDINSTQVAGNGTDTITITFNDKISDGQHWALLMDNTCLRDNSGNYFAGFANVTEYNFWSKYVAQPVVRVFRYSHNIGAQEPNNTLTDDEKTAGYKLVDSVTTTNITEWTDNGGSYNDASANSATKIAPTGYAQVRIDCETPGAVIKFSVYNGGLASEATNYPPETQNNSNDKYDVNGKISDVSNKPKSEMQTAETSYNLGQRIIIGDGTYTTSRKDYVTAQATAPTDASSMENSTFGYEGIFKTVVNYQGHESQIQIQGGTFNGGMPSIPGFPLRDAVQGEDSRRYNQNTYYAGSNNHYWVTYDIISEYSILSVYKEKNWSQMYSYGEYGQLSVLSDISHYN